METGDAERSMDPVCPLCESPIHPGEHVMFSHRDMVHVRCIGGTERLADTVAEYLEHSAPRRFCHTCLVTTMHITFDDARKATARLRMRPGFKVEIDHCSACGADRVTIGSGG